GGLLCAAGFGLAFGAASAGVVESTNAPNTAPTVQAPSAEIRRPISPPSIRGSQGEIYTRTALGPGFDVVTEGRSHAHTTTPCRVGFASTPLAPLDQLDFQ